MAGSARLLLLTAVVITGLLLLVIALGDFGAAALPTVAPRPRPVRRPTPPVPTRTSIPRPRAVTPAPAIRDTPAPSSPVPSVATADANTNAPRESTPDTGFGADATFLSFEPWPGGWNNRRIALETALWMGCLLNRTVIVPPMKDEGDEHMFPDKMLWYHDAYDFSAMATAGLPSIQLADFLRRGGVEHISKRDGYPTLAEESRNDEALQTNRRPLTDVMRHCGKLHPNSRDQLWCVKLKSISARAEWQSPGHGYYSVPFHGATGGPAASFPTDPIRQGRHPKRLPVTNATVVHFSRNLLVTWSSFAYVDEALYPHGHTCRVRMRDGLVYRHEVHSWAAKFIAELGGVDGYSAVHARRKDFFRQFPYAVTDPAKLLAKFAPLYHQRPGETVLVGTDDDADARKLLTNATEELETHSVKSASFQLDVLRRAKVFSDLQANAAMVRGGLRRSLQPLVVQLVLSNARTFAANPVSTFSSLVVRLRGYRGAPTHWHHTGLGPGPALAPVAVDPKRTPTYAHEDPRAWQGLERNATTNASL